MIIKKFAFAICERQTVVSKENDVQLMETPRIGHRPSRDPRFLGPLMQTHMLQAHWLLGTVLSTFEHHLNSLSWQPCIVCTTVNSVTDEEIDSQLWLINNGTKNTTQITRNLQPKFLATEF